MVKKILLATVLLIAGVRIAYEFIPSSASDTEIVETAEVIERENSSSTLQLDEKERKEVKFGTFSIKHGKEKDTYSFREGITSEEWALGEYNTDGWTVQGEKVLSPDGKYFFSSKLHMQDGKEYTARQVQEKNSETHESDKNEKLDLQEDVPNAGGTLHTINSKTPLFIKGLEIRDDSSEAEKLSLIAIKNTLICGCQYNIYLSCIQSEYDFDKMGICLLKGNNIKKFGGVLNRDEKDEVIFYAETPFPKDSSDYCASLAAPNEPGKAVLMFTFDDIIISYVELEIKSTENIKDPE